MAGPIWLFDRANSSFLPARRLAEQHIKPGIGVAAGGDAPADHLWVCVMQRNPILDVPLSAVMRMDIALPLQQILNIGTVGALLGAWRYPKNQRSIEELFETPEQARHAVAVCATWLGIHMKPIAEPVLAWWRKDEDQQMSLDA